MEDNFRNSTRVEPGLANSFQEAIVNTETFYDTTFRLSKVFDEVVVD